MHMCKFFTTFVPEISGIMKKITKAQVKLIKSLQQKKYRDELGLFVAEGEKCVSELAKAFELVYLIVEDGLIVPTVLQRSGLTGEVGHLTASAIEISQMSGLRTPQGVIGVFKKPITNHQSPITNSGLVLALDGIQDPGNLGTIIRTCDWFGVHDIVCSQDTADCYNPKVVQATMGALARVRVHYVNLPAWLQSQITNHQSQIKIYGTLLDGKDMYEVLRRTLGTSANEEHSDRRTEAGVARQFSRVVLTNATSLPNVIVMGNEGNGISPEVRKFVTHPIRIPSYPKDAETSESLNVSIATAIVLAEFRRLGL